MEQTQSKGEEQPQLRRNEFPVGVGHRHKPRQTRGTPAFRARRIFAAAIIGVAVVLGAFSLSRTTPRQQWLLDQLVQDDEAIRKRRFMMDALRLREADELKKDFKHYEDPRRQY